MSQRTKLEHIETVTGHRDNLLDHAPIPEAALRSWEYWLDLSSGRTVNGFGAAPLSWLDIDAWARMTDTHPTHTELALIRTIDRAFLEAQQATKG